MRVEGQDGCTSQIPSLYALDAGQPSGLAKAFAMRAGRIKRNPFVCRTAQMVHFATDTLYNTRLAVRKTFRPVFDTWRRWLAVETHRVARTWPGKVHFIRWVHRRCRRCGNLGDAADAADAADAVPDAVSDTVQALDLPARAYAAVDRGLGGRVRAGLARFWAQQELQCKVDQALPEQQLLRCCRVCKGKTQDRGWGFEAGIGVLDLICLDHLF